MLGGVTMSDDHVLDRVERFIRDFVVLPDEQLYGVVALWCAHTHIATELMTSPRLAIYSPEYGCGKSRLLEVLELLCHDPQLLANASAAYIFRRVHQSQQPPTLLLDEADAIWNGAAAGDTHQELRGLINSGYRAGAMVGRIIGAQRDQVANFRTFAPVALAGRGRKSIPDSVATRAVHVEMRKRARGERLLPWNYRDTTPRGHALRTALAEWSAARLGRVDAVVPQMPEQIVDRDLEVWEPLAIIADLAGGDWPERIRDAAVHAVTEGQLDPGDVPLGRRLLADVRAVFGDDTRVSTGALLDRLNSLPESPWSTRREGAGLDSYGLGRMLREYGIRSLDIRFAEGVRKGYERESFEVAWRSYLCDSVPNAQVSATSATSATSSQGQTASDRGTGSVADVAHVADAVGLTPCRKQGCRSAAGASGWCGPHTPTDPDRQVTIP